jgi:hypothetical protein
MSVSSAEKRRDKGRPRGSSTADRRILAGALEVFAEPGRTSIDLVTTHTVTVDGNTIPISAPYTRVALD